MRDGSIRSLAESTSRERTFSLLSDEKHHKVWKPKLNLSDIVAAKIKKHKSEVHHNLLTDVSSSPRQHADEMQKSLSVQSLQQADAIRRQKTLMKRVNIAKMLLEKDSLAEDTATTETSGSARWKAAARKVMHSSSVKQKKDFTFLVAEIVAQRKQNL